MSKWKFSRLLSFAMSAALVFTSVIPSYAAEDFLEEDPEIASFEDDAELQEDVGGIANLMAVPSEVDITYEYTLDGTALTDEEVSALGIANTSPSSYTSDADNDVDIQLVAPTSTDGHIAFSGYSASNDLTVTEDLKVTVAQNTEPALVITGAFVTTKYDVTVTLDLDGGIAGATFESPETYVIGKAAESTVEVSLPSVTKEGYSLNGWTIGGTDASKFSITGSTLKVGENALTADAAITLTANWDSNNTTVNITYELDGGNGATSGNVTILKAVGSTYTIPTVTKKGATLNAWTISGTDASKFSITGNTLKVVENALTGPAEITLTASWTAEEYPVSFYKVLTQTSHL